MYVWINVPEPIPTILNECKYMVNPTVPADNIIDNNVEKDNDTIINVILNTSSSSINVISQTYIDNAKNIYKYDFSSKSMESIILDVSQISNTTITNQRVNFLANLPSLDLFQGSIIGVAVGDTIGLGVEGLPRDQCFDYVSNLRNNLKSMTYPWKKVLDYFNSRGKEESAKTIEEIIGKRFTVGQVSDDTQCSLALIESIVNANGFSAQAFSDSLVNLHINPGIVGQGGTSKATLDELATKKLSWLNASFASGNYEEMYEKKSSNGSVMRVGALGLWGWADPTSVTNLENAVLSSHVTHSHPDCKIGATMLVIAVASAVHARAVGKDDPAEFIIKNLEMFDQQIGQVLRMMNDSKDWEAAANVLHQELPLPDNQRSDFYKKKEICPYPQHTAAWAIYSFLSNTNDFWEAIFCSMQVGGDTDTCAACCGAIAGAYSGLDLIIKGREDSKYVLNALHDETQMKKISFSALKSVGEQLHNTCTRLTFNGASVPSKQAESSNKEIALYIHNSGLISNEVVNSNKYRIIKDANDFSNYEDECKSTGKSPVLIIESVSVSNNILSPNDIQESILFIRKCVDWATVIVYGRATIMNNLSHHSFYHDNCRCVALTLHDALEAAERLSMPSLNSVNNTQTNSIGVQVIGISGCSRSGKSTLTKNLIEVYKNGNNIWTVMGDTYFRMNWLSGGYRMFHTKYDYKKYTLGKYRHGPWDSPGAYDHVKLLNQARIIIKEAEAVYRNTGVEQYVIIEGFTLFVDPLIYNLFDTHLYIELQFADARKRRMATTPLPPVYYDTFLWPRQLKYHDNTLHKSNYNELIYLDGADPENVLLKKAVDAIGQGQNNGSRL